MESKMKVNVIKINSDIENAYVKPIRNDKSPETKVSSLKAISQYLMIQGV